MSTLVYSSYFVRYNVKGMQLTIMWYGRIRIMRDCHNQYLNGVVTGLSAQESAKVHDSFELGIQIDWNVN